MMVAHVKYKKTGLDWMPEVPEHWEVVRLKAIINSGTNGVWGDEPKNNSEDLVCVRVADIDQWTYGISEENLTLRNIETKDQEGRLLKYGDLIIEKSGGGDLSPVGRVVFYNLNRKAVSSNFMARLNIINDINREFLFYYFKFLYRGRLNVPSIKATTGIQNLDLYSYLQNPIPIPPLSEQDSIVQYIKGQEEKINRFIEKKQRFIELLKEQRLSIVNNYVTSETESWIWLRLKDIVTVNDEAITEKTEDDFLIRYIDIGNVNSYGDIAEIQEYEFKDAPSRARRIVRKGDVIISTVRTYLKAITLIESDEENLIASTGFAVLRPKENVLSEYLNFALRAEYFISSVIQNSYGVSYPAINSSTLSSLKIVIPKSTSEQREIINKIKTETATIDTAIAKAEREIELIREYKEAMVSEAVMGKRK